MGEDVVVNLFLWVRVALVGSIFIILPRITRKGLLFGVYVGEEFADGNEAREVLRRWTRGVGVVMAAALLVGLAGTLAGQAVAGNLTGTAVLLLGGTWLYFRSHARVKALPRPDVERRAGRAVAALQVTSVAWERLTKLTLAICVLVAVGTLFYAGIRFSDMNPTMPTLWSLIGGADGWTDTSLLTVMYIPSWSLFLGPLFALLGLMTASAKRSLRDGPGGRSVEAQDAFRAFMASVFCGTALFICALLTAVAVQVVRIGLGEASSLSIEILWLVLAMLVYMVGSLAWIIRRYGQGGALLERGAIDGALTGGLADNRHWYGGVFYFDRDDPSLMVESRFGIGYTMNYGNRIALSLNILFGAVLVVLVALGFFL